VIGGVAAIVVVVVGGPYVYIHFIEGKAPPPLSLSTITTPTTVAAGQAAATTTMETASSPVDGTWNVAAGSAAGYRIKETLFGQSNTASAEPAPSPDR
jgi:hypothetical protein